MPKRWNYALTTFWLNKQSALWENVVVSLGQLEWFTPAPIVAVGLRTERDLRATPSTIQGLFLKQIVRSRKF